MKLFTYLITFLLLICPLFSSAQGENNNWHFGRGRSLSFNPNPVYSSNSNIYTSESSVAVSDAQGNLLFYTMGSRVWDRNGNEMPNATGLLGNGPVMNNVPIGSASHGVQVIKNPANPNQYYIFAMDPFETSSSKKIYYHLVDMSLNNGLGDVVANMKNIVLLQAEISEVLTSTKGNDCMSYWLMVRMGASMGNAFYAYKIDASGVHTTPVITTTPANTQTVRPVTVFTKSGKDLYALANGSLLKAQFDNITGVVSNFELIPMVGFVPYFLCLSPDESKLYTSQSVVGEIKQYNLSLYPSLTAIGNSATVLGPTPPSSLQTPVGDIRVGPDQKLYIPRSQPTIQTWIYNQIDRIEYPNLAGAAATYTNNFIPADSGTRISLGSNIVVNVPTDTVIKSRQDTHICNTNSITLYASFPNSGIHLWSTGATSPSITVSTPGTYWVYTQRECTVTIDSFKVSMVNNQVFLGHDTTLCNQEGIFLDVYSPDIDSYLWQDGSIGSGMAITEPGTYYVTTSKQGCTASDTLVVSKIIPFVSIAESDTTICKSVLLELHAEANLPSSYTWNNGSSGKMTRPLQTGWYTVTAQNACGEQKDSVHVSMLHCDCQIMIPNAFSPNKDGVNDKFVPVFASGCDLSFYELIIYNRYGQPVFRTQDAQQGWDGTYPKGGMAEAGVYIYMLQYRDSKNLKDIQTYKGDILLVK